MAVLDNLNDEKIDAINSNLETKNKKISGNLYLDKSGNVCVLSLMGYSTQFNNVIPIDCRPKNTIRSIVRYSDGNGFYPALLSIQSDGTMNGTFIKDNTVNNFLTSGILYGQAVWCI